MSRILIGSSNVYRFFNGDNLKGKWKVSMVRCTEINGFKANMMNIEKEDKEVAISVIKNFLATAAKDKTTEEGVFTRLGKVMDVFMNIVQTAARRRPSTTFAIAAPIRRPKLNWYNNNYDNIITAFDEGIGKMKLKNVCKIIAMPFGCEQFEEDGVHLTAASGEIFVEAILSEANKVFEAIIIDDDPADPAAGDLEVRVGVLEGQVRERQRNDNAIFAKLREEMDEISNKAKEDRLIITGLTSKTPPPTEPEAKKTWLRKIVTDIFELLVPGFQGKIVFLNQMKNKGQHIPMVEVKLDSVLHAATIRKTFAEKKKEGKDLGRIFVANCVNPATRVRVDILKAIARKISNKDTAAHAVPFVSKPIIHVRPTDPKSGQNPRSYSFAEAVTKFGHLVKQVELGEAYRRAGNSFKGQLEQCFIILKEQQPQAQQHQQQQHSGSEFNGRKRPRDDESSNHGGQQRGGYNKRPWRGQGSGSGSGSGRRQY